MKIHLSHIQTLNPCSEGIEFAQEQFAAHADEDGFMDLSHCKEVCHAHDERAKHYYAWLANIVHQPEFYLCQEDHRYEGYRVGVLEYPTFDSAQAASAQAKSIWPNLIHEWAPMRKITNADLSGHSWIYLHDERYKAESPAEI